MSDHHIKRINERSIELIKEFDVHRKEVREISNSNSDNDRLIFESWAIQKIAGLHVIIEEINEKLNSIDLLPGEN